ncbi:hypothetical protein SprV_0401714100 [Sparganum proliferum]
MEACLLSKRQGSRAIARLLQPLGIRVAHRPEATIKRLIMRPKDPMSRGETENVVYRVQCSSCEANYVEEAGKQLQTRMKCRNPGPKKRRIARETIEAWHTGTTSINPCVALPAAYQALPAQLSKQMSRREPRLNMNPDMSESMADAHSVTPQPGSDEGAVVTTAVPSTSPADEKTDSRCGVNKIASLGRQLRSMKVRTTTTNVSTPAPDVD